MRRWAIRATNVALFVACCFLAARIAVVVLAETVLPPSVEATPVRAARAAPVRSWADTEVILARNLFGAKVAGEQSAPPVVEIELEETKLPLELLGTVAGEDESVSNAAIQDLGTRKHQVVFVGDALDNHPDVRVARIERKRVVLANGARREELRLDDERAPAPRQRAARGPRRARPKRPRQRERVSQQIDRARQEAGERTTASLYSQARIVPKWENGAMVGVQLNQIKPGSLYEKLGIQSGDVVTSLNGVTIDSPQASSRLLTEFTTAEEFTVELQGGRVIEVDSEELSTLLGEGGS